MYEEDDIDQILKRFTKPKMRPMRFMGYHNGKKVYQRKKTLSKFQLYAKYPKKHSWFEIPKVRHIFEKQHFLTPEHLRIKPSIKVYAVFVYIAFIVLLGIAAKIYFAF